MYWISLHTSDTQMLRAWNPGSNDSFTMPSLTQRDGSNRDELWKTVLTQNGDPVMTRRDPVVQGHVKIWVELFYEVSVKKIFYVPVFYIV